MATFRNRHGKWQARVRRLGQQPITKSFQNKQDVNDGLGKSKPIPIKVATPT